MKRNDDMTRDDDTVGGGVETSVAFVVWRVADENTQSGARAKFVEGGGLVAERLG
jgi:hypothetical protein